jgi:prepilin-type N-terminal cleavage/methylation domain-containing protein
MIPRSRWSRGFTLIEIMVALVIGGLAVSGAAGLLHAIGHRGEDFSSAAEVHDRDANADRLIRTLVSNLDLRPRENPSIAGDGQRIVLHSWCTTPRGWIAPCRATLMFEQGSGGVTLQLDLATDRHDSVALSVRHGTSGHFRYLVSPDAGGTWTEAWTEVTVPAAIAVIIDQDTLLAGVWTGG